MCLTPPTQEKYIYIINNIKIHKNIFTHDYFIEKGENGEEVLRSINEN